MDFQARLSRDGTRIAFTRWWDDSLSDGVYVMKATGGDELFLAGASCPAWGSDGRTLAVRSESDLSISIIDAETGLTIRKVRDIGYLFGGVDWSHDGRWITFNAAHYPDIGVGRVDVSTGTYATLVAGSARNARWSDDDRRLVYECGTPESSGIYIVDSGGGAHRAVLIDGSGFVFRAPAWLGDAIVCNFAYAQASEESYGLVIADTTGAWRPLSLSGSDADFDPKQRRLVFSRVVPSEPPSGATRLFAAGADGGGLRQLTRKK